MKDNIIKLYNVLVKDGVKFPNEVKDSDSFEKKYFSSKETTDDFWSWMHKTKYDKGKNKGKIYFPGDSSKFYKTYVCDLDWAKDLQICGVNSSQSTPQQNSIIPDEDTIKKIKERGGDYIIGLKGNELLVKLQHGWESAIKFGDKTVAYLKKKYYNLTHGQSIYDTPDNSGTSTSNNNKVSNGVYTTKGDPYQYKIVDCVWYTKSLENRGKIIKDWKSLEGNDKATKILDGRFPNARKGCEKTDNTQNNNTQTTTPTAPTPPPVVLPTWAECIGSSLKGAIVTKDDSNVEIIMAPFGKDMGYFWDDKIFMFVYANGEKIEGTWSCEGNQLFIRTKDGEQWSSSTQWIKQPSKSINPSVNYQTTGININNVMDKSPSTDSQPTTLETAPTEPVKKPDVTTESYNGLEDVLSNINSFINEIEMEQIITEQAQTTIQVPADELNILNTNPVLKATGQLITLCKSENGTSKPVNVSGKLYFAGKQIKLNATLGSKDGFGYLVYDGRILVNTGGCNYAYAKQNNNIVTIDGIPPQELKLQYVSLLKQFGIDPYDYNSDFYFLIGKMTDKLQDLINVGAKSMVFKSWQDMLIHYYSDGSKRLVDKGDSFNYPTNDELYQYRLITADNLGLKYLDRQIQIYIPLEAAVVTGAKKVKYDPVGCQVELKTYLASAFEFMMNGQNNPNVNINTVREHLRGCYSHGMFDKDKFKGLQQGDLDVQFSKENNPFKFWKQGSVLSIDNIKQLLTGKNRNLPIVSGGRKNPYLNFYIDTMKESKLELDNIIKENLTKLKREKDNSLLIETKIVKSRTELLSENRILKFKEPREKFFNEIISEAMYFKKQGFDKQIIKEEFWDSLKGLFGEHGSNAIFTTFKEYMGKYLVGKLTSINPNGWMGENIKEAINKIHIEDLDKITDCDFISRKISTSISDSIISKVSKGQEIEGGNISSIVKSGLDKSIDRTELTKNIHEGITKLICPVLGDVSKKLKEKGEEIKLKAVRP